MSTEKYAAVLWKLLKAISQRGNGKAADIKSGLKKLNMADPTKDIYDLRRRRKKSSGGGKRRRRRHGRRHADLLSENDSDTDSEKKSRSNSPVSPKNIEEPCDRAGRRRRKGGKSPRRRRRRRH